MLNIAHAQKIVEEESGSQVADIISYIISHIPLWITAIIVLFISFIIAKIVKSSIENRLTAEGVEEEHKGITILAGRVANAAVLIIGITVSLKIAGIDLTALLAALAFGLSFGLQDTVANFVAGLALLATRPFVIGDWIKVNGKTGKVTEIRTRATYLQTFDGLRLIVPNSELYKSSVLSFTSNSMRRIKVPVYCRYGANLEEITKICLNSIKKHQKILREPKPSVIVSELGDFYIELQLRFWIITGTNWFKLKSALTAEIEQMLEEAGLDAPYPVTSISMEEDVEGAVINMRTVDGAAHKEILDDRKNYYELAARKKEELVKEEPEIDQPTNNDQLGAAFLQSAEMLAPVQVPVQVDNTNINNIQNASS
jgi:small conductance mechanosensitive channel